MSPLLKLPVDLTFLTISYLLPNDILVLRQTCKDLSKLTRDRAVWISQYEAQILSKGHPFPSSIPLESMEAHELERQIHICDRVSQKWAGLAEGRYTYPRDSTRFALCQRVRDFEVQRRADVGVKIRSVHFLNLHGRDLVLVHYKDDWSVLEVWDLRGEGEVGSEVRKVAEWGPRGTIVKNVVVGGDGDGDGELGVKIAVGVMLPPEDHLVQILTLTPSLTFEVTASIRTYMNPIAFHGNLVAVGDHLSKSLLWNWNASRFACMDGDLVPNRECHTTYSPDAEDDPIGTMNPIIDVVFARDYAFVARAYTLTLFPIPTEFHATLNEAMEHSAGFLAKHSFGCVDAACITPIAPLNGTASPNPSYHILVRGFSNDSWRDRNSHVLQLYTLDHIPPPSSSSPPSDSPLPYIFPPRLEAHIPTKYGRLTCHRVFMGKAGVALWMQPKRSGMRFQEEEYYGIDHYADAPHIRLSDQGEAHRLNAAILMDSPYRFDAGDGEMSTGFMEEAAGEIVQLDPILVKANHDSDADWTCIDWDEAGGRIVLGLQNGWVTLLEM